jgi:alkylation response protein AidB-like acyl-CoA dehydrogenase
MAPFGRGAGGAYGSPDSRRLAGLGQAAVAYADTAVLRRGPMPTRLLDAARELRPLIDANARAAGDAATTLPRATVDALVEANLHGANVPREVGGAELSLTDTIDVFAEVARADGSTGWSLMASASTACFFGAWAGDDVAEKMFAERVPLCAGQFAPNGTARRDGDGWVISGDYQFGSGIDSAEWVGAGAFTDEDPPDILFAIFPAEEAQRRGGWDVMGLRATASEDYAVREVRVPDGATFRLFSPVRRRGGPVYELGVMGLTTVGHTGFALGVVRRALDELVEIARTKHRMGAAAPLRESERFLHALGTLECRARANEELARAEFSAAQARLEAHPAPDPALTNRLRAVTVHVTQDGADIVRQCYLLAGTTGLREGPLERCFRDIHAGTQHFFASPAGPTDFGRDLLGPLEPPTA